MKIFGDLIIMTKESNFYLCSFGIMAPVLNPISVGFRTFVSATAFRHSLCLLLAMHRKDMFSDQFFIHCQSDFDNAAHIV